MNLTHHPSNSNTDTLFVGALHNNKDYTTLINLLISNLPTTPASTPSRLIIKLTDLSPVYDPLHITTLKTLFDRYRLSRYTIELILPPKPLRLECILDHLELPDKLYPSSSDTQIIVLNNSIPKLTTSTHLTLKNRYPEFFSYVLDESIQQKQKLLYDTTPNPNAIDTPLLTLSCIQLNKLKLLADFN